jgi:hypothetical protein
LVKIITRSRLEPAPDHRLGFATPVAEGPAGIDIRRVDGVEAVVDEGIQQRKAGCLVNRPTKDITTKHDGRGCQATLAKRAVIYGQAPVR